MKAKKKRKTQVEQSVNTSFTVIFPVYNVEGFVDHIFAPIRNFFRKRNGQDELIIVDLGSNDHLQGALKNHELYAELEKSGNAQILEAGTLGEGLTKAANKARGNHILTWTNGSSVNPDAIHEWNLRDIRSDQILIGKRTANDLTSKKSLKAITAKEERSGQKFRRFSNSRITDPDNPIKIYPANIARYLFAQTTSDSNHFEAEVLHRAELEGIPVIEKPVGVKQGIAFGTNVKSNWLKTFFSCLAFKFNYQLKEPIRAILNKEAFDRPSTLTDPQYGNRLGFSLMLLLLFFLMPVLSVDFGIIVDGPIQFVYGRKLLEYYASFGVDKSALELRNLYLYGGLFDVIATGAAQIFDPLIEGNYKYEIRHVVNALFGCLGILFTGLLGKYLGGWRCGLLAVLFLALSPRFFGHSMNNPKDIPFATFFIMSLYFMVKYFKEFPAHDKKTLIWLIVGIACAINIRVGGLILIAFFGLFSLIELGRNLYTGNLGSLQKSDYLKKTIKTGALVVILSYFGGLVFWPYGHLAPFTNPFSALSELSSFSNTMEILFNGEEIWSNKIPWHYIFTYLGITSPLFVLLGFGLFLGNMPFARNSSNFRFLLYILFAAFFPAFYIIYKDSNLYDCIRQVLFIYPPIVLLSSWGISKTYERLRRREMRIAITILLCILMFLPVRHMARNHPHQYVYYNEIIGGVDGAYGRFELDYWNNSSKGAAKAIGRYVQENVPADSTVKVYAMFSKSVYPILYRYHNNWKIIHGKSFETRHEKDWDFAMFIARYLSPEILKNEWPPEETFYKEKVENATINVVLKKDDL